MLNELTPEQRFELTAYFAMEPFGEVREDMRMARWLQFYYDAKRGKKGAARALGEFMLYDDFMEAARGNQASEASMLRALEK